MDFNSIIGQDIIVESLKNAVKNGKAANGYIFSGPAGCGKKLTATIFAMALNCGSKIGGNPCGVCNSCLRVKNCSHPNVEIVKPTGATIKIKQIRDIISEVARKPFENGYKTVIMEDAGKMTHDAQDAFLKTLEEPPDNTVFILLAENHNRILPTILSRCQIYQFKAVDRKKIKEYLKGRHEFSDDDIDIAARHSGGVIGRALELLQDKEFLKTRETYLEILDKALTGNRSDALRLASQAIDTKEAAESFLNFSLEWFRDLVIFSDMEYRNEGLLLNIYKISDLSKHNSLLTENQLNSIMEMIKNTIRYVGYNVGIKNSIDGMLLSIAEVISYNGKDGRS